LPGVAHDFFRGAPGYFTLIGANAASELAQFCDLHSGTLHEPEVERGKHQDNSDVRYQSRPQLMLEE
jgi:hypothetical protein